MLWNCSTVICSLSFIHLLNFLKVCFVLNTVLGSHDSWSGGEQINKHMMTMWCDEYLSTKAAGGPTLWPIGPLYDVAPPFLQALPLIPPHLHYRFPSSFSVTSRALFWFPCSCFVSGYVHMSFLCQDLLPDSSHVPSFSWSSQLKCHFFRDPFAIHWSVALDFLHVSIFISSFVAHIKCIITYPPT